MKNDNVNFDATIPNMVTPTQEDHERLANIVTETQIAREILNLAQRDVEVTTNALNMIYGTYVKTQKLHDKIWRETLEKYVGEENAYKNGGSYKYDLTKKAIFIPAGAAWME